jgi:hypothetical protein
MKESEQANIGTENLAELIAARFPVLRKSMQKCDSSYSACGRLAQFVNEAIQTKDIPTVKAAVALVETFHANGDESVRNSLYCDFFEVLDLRSETGEKVYLDMSVELQKLYVKAQDYIGNPFRP